MKYQRQPPVALMKAYDESRWKLRYFEREFDHVFEKLDQGSFVKAGRTRATGGSCEDVVKYTPKLGRTG